MISVLEGTENYPERVAWISIRISRSEMPLPSEGDLLTEEDIQKLLHAADHPRDKAFVSMLWESGCRVGEVGNLKLKHNKAMAYGHNSRTLTKIVSKSRSEETL